MVGAYPEHGIVILSTIAVMGLMKKQAAVSNSKISVAMYDFTHIFVYS